VRPLGLSLVLVLLLFAFFCNEQPTWFLNRVLSLQRLDWGVFQEVSRFVLLVASAFLVVCLFRSPLVPADASFTIWWATINIRTLLLWALIAQATLSVAADDTSHHASRVLLLVRMIGVVVVARLAPTALSGFALPAPTVEVTPPALL
jgi:hypothetical protein